MTKLEKLEKLEKLDKELGFGSVLRVNNRKREVAADMDMVAFAETSDFYRIDAASKLDPKKRSALGQYMTPSPIARFMSSLFSSFPAEVRVLDPGAGVGSLTAALAEQLATTDQPTRSVNFHCYEIEPLLIDYLQQTIDESCALLARQCIRPSAQLREEDFILDRSKYKQQQLFDEPSTSTDDVTHVIMNPPYKKIASASAHRTTLRAAGLETSNLYTGFLFLAAQRLQKGGELVAIVPRSFCNGPYFKPFRLAFFGEMCLKQIHIFEHRNTAFKGDDVLQENIIIHSVKGGKPSSIKITTSRDGNFFFDSASGRYCAEDMTQRTAPYASVLNPDDQDLFVHIATNGIEQGIVDRMAHFSATLDDLGVSVSTGPVVDFRLKSDLRQEPEKQTSPLLYPTHFRGGSLEWPKVSKKPNAIAVSDASRRWLWTNNGNYVITKRFTSKEERRRVVAFTYRSELPGELVGFENHLNVFHANQRGLPRGLADGLTTYLNSTLVDLYFRQFNGHTQVNATDLRSLRYPSCDALKKMGRKAQTASSQRDIDNIIEKELTHMTDTSNPLEAQEKVDEALEVLKALGMPKGQQNDRSALTLLALLNLGPEGTWSALEKPLMRITPIMEFCREHYGREYAPNTRETFRRQTMHQFVEAGIALYNPDKPDRAVNSSKACYQISEEVFAVIQTFGEKSWEKTFKKYLEGQETLAAKLAKHRSMQMIPVTVAEGTELALTLGAHSELIKDIIEEFAPRFAPGSEVIYVGDTGDKRGFFQEERLANLGVTVDQHGKMTDVVLFYKKKGWLLLVESVTSHGPVDAKRHNELVGLFANSKPGIVYVTAFPDRSVMARYLSDISWETEVWCADAPTHLIHFNGERFLGPYV